MLKTVREQKKNSKLEMIDIQRDFEGIGYSGRAVGVWQGGGGFGHLERSRQLE